MPRLLQSLFPAQNLSSPEHTVERARNVLHSRRVSLAVFNGRLGVPITLSLSIHLGTKNATRL